MAFRLIDGDWHKVMREAAKADRSALRVVCPFIKLSAASKLRGLHTLDTTVAALVLLCAAEYLVPTLDYAEIVG